MDPATHDDTRTRRRIGPWHPDRAADLADFEPDTNFFVRAAAGSGKTTSLVARMVALIRTGVPVDDLAAITFTRKAAGEMSTRFVHELRRTLAALDASGAESQAARVRTALSEVHRAFIGTVHSFCARLLRERPLAAGLPPDFTAGIDERDERRLRERAWQDYVQHVRDDDPERIERLVAMGIEPGDLMFYFNTLCRYPELDVHTCAPAEPPDLQAAVHAAAKRMMDWQARRPDPPPKGRDRVMKALDRAERMRRFRPLDTDAERADFLRCFADMADTESAHVKVSYWAERGTDAYEAARSLRDEELPRLIRDTVQPALRRWDAVVHEAVVRFTEPAVSFYQARRRQDGQLTFHDLLLHTRSLLRDHPSVRTFFQQRYPRLLVDEFQDTDPLQAELLFFLSSRDATETDWTACTPRPGSLFIVGDDKQSIYRFRRADKEVFDQVGRHVKDAGGERVDLTKNFRSLGRICEWCNEAFSALFARNDDASELDRPDLQAPYVPFDPQRPAGHDEVGLRRIEVDPVRGNWGSQIAAQDATRIARFIRRAVSGEAPEEFVGTAGDPAAVFSGDPRYDDFLILTRVKARLSTYAETLAQHGIPYTVTGSEDLGASGELKALVDVLTCALRPDDAVACVAYLKGPLVGLSDDDLFRYHQAGGAFDRMHEPVPEAVLRALPESLAERVDDACAQLRDARRSIRQQRPGAAVEHIADRFGLLAQAAHPPDPSEHSLRAGYVLRALHCVQHRAAQGHDMGAICDDLQRIVDGEEAVDGMTLDTGAGDAVRLMNVHQAKGLEAPVVFLADPYSRGSGRQTPTRHVRREAGTLVAPVVQGEGHYQRVTHAPLDWPADTEPGYAAVEAQHTSAEEDRLLYVAATRAENLLVVSTYPKKSAEGYWAPLYPFLDAADVPALEVGAAEPPPTAHPSAPDLDATRAQREAQASRARRPSYAETTVTERTRDADASAGAVQDAPGRAFGRALHTLVETLVESRADPPDVTPAFCRAVLRASDL